MGSSESIPLHEWLSGGFKIEWKPIPAEDLRGSADSLMDSVRDKLRGVEFRYAMDQLARDNSMDGIRNRQEAAYSRMADTFIWDWRDANRGRWSQQELGSALQAAAADFRTNATQLSEHMPQAAEAASDIPQESPVAKAAEAIGDALRQVDVSKIGPIGLLILVFWLIFFQMNIGQIAGMTFFYMVLTDYLKKQE